MKNLERLGGRCLLFSNVARRIFDTPSCSCRTFALSRSLEDIVEVWQR